MSDEEFIIKTLKEWGLEKWTSKFLGNSWQICSNFKRGCCFDVCCAFVHKYKYCFDYQNATCSREMCPFIHVTSVEQARYEATGKASEYLTQEVGRTLQNTNICKNFKNDNCNRENCNLRHVQLNRSLECPICCEEVEKDTFGTCTCGHMICYTCALKCIFYTHGERENNDSIRIKCPMCRSIEEYKKLK